MQIRVNGKALEVASKTLEGLLSELECDEALVATALNHDFVRRSQRGQIELQEGDEVEILSPRQGG